VESRTQRATWIITAVLVAAFAVRMVAAAWWQSRLPPGVQFGFGDSHSYWVLAEAVSRGGPYRIGPDGPALFRTPGYPLLLAPLFWLRHDPPVTWARAEGALLGTVAVAATMWLARELFTPRISCVAGALAALYPGAIGTSIFVLSEAPYSPLVVAQIACWVAAWRAADWRSLSIWAILAGLAAGAATLVRPSHLLFIPFALALAMFGHGRRRNIVIGALMLAAFAVTMMPWWVRGYRVTGTFVATTLQLGASLYDGLNPHATGASDMRFVPEFVEAQRRSDESRGQPLPGTFEQRLDARLRSASVEWARNHPVSVARLALAKFARMWNPWPNAAEFQSGLFRWTVFLSYTPLAALAACGCWWHLRRGWPFVLCTLPALYLTLLHMVFVSSLRYREPAMLPLIVLASGAFHRPRSRPSDSYTEAV
jgi:4-amino-4-deoxy-L-arabinose transferase-like glycosyltransferase